MQEPVAIPAEGRQPPRTFQVPVGSPPQGATVPQVTGAGIMPAGGRPLGSPPQPRSDPASVNVMIPNVSPTAFMRVIVSKA